MSFKKEGEVLVFPDHLYTNRKDSERLAQSVLVLKIEEPVNQSKTEFFSGQGTLLKGCHVRRTLD